MTIKDALSAVRDRIHRAAVAASRSPDAIQLIAVSKTKPASMIREAYEAGQRAFGESYAQELVQKADELIDLHDLSWHFIGHLQTNKAKYVARAAHFVHTVESVVLARELGKRAKKEGRGDITERLPVLVEVNVGGEPQKHGATAAELRDVLDAIAEEPSLRARGLMTLPPQDLEGARRAFEALVSLQALHGGRAKLPELSMGMSHDLEVAIACGATMVRVGTAIFGER